MTTHSGQLTSYTNTVGQKRMITDRILLASPYRIPTIQALGLDNTSKFSFVNNPGRVYEWLEDTYNPTTDLTDDGLTSGTTTTTFTPDTINMYQVGDVIKVDSELMWVSANSGVYLTVTRGFGSTTAATHANDSTILLVSSARLEGADASNGPSSIQTTTSNYSTILAKFVNVSRSDMLFPRYGISDIKEYHIDKNMDELMLHLNRMPFHSKASAGSASAARYTAGFDSYISTNVTNAASAALTRKAIDDLLVSIWGYGGNPRMILCNTWVKRKINSFFEGFVRTERSERMGGMNITMLEHPLGGEPIEVIVDAACQTDRLYLLDPDHVGYITIDPFFYEDLAKTGDGEKGQTVGEYGFVLAFEKAHGYIYGLSTTA